MYIPNTEIYVYIIFFGEQTTTTPNRKIANSWRISAHRFLASSAPWKLMSNASTHKTQPQRTLEIFLKCIYVYIYTFPHHKHGRLIQNRRIQCDLSQTVVYYSLADGVCLTQTKHHSRFATLT